MTRPTSRDGLLAMTAILAVVTAATLAAMWPVLSNGFVNWDDPDVLIANAPLRETGLLAWAFTTNHMGHYQPLSWLVWAWTAGTPPAPDRVHAVSLIVHVVNVGLLLLVYRNLAAGVLRRQPSPWSLVAAVLFFAVHPLRVEPVAWASAFPYLLSYALLLCCVWCWIRWCRFESRVWLVAATALFALSQLARVTAPLAPLVLAAAAALIVAPERRGRRLTFALAALAVIAIASTMVEAHARSTEDLAVGSLATAVAALVGHPGLYLWRSLAPVGLTPLDPLPLAASIAWTPLVANAAVFALVVFLTWRFVSPRASAALWGSYLALLLPFIGLAQSGLQATADRYTYGPAMVLSAGLVLALNRRSPREQRHGLAAMSSSWAIIAPHWRRGSLMAGAVVVVALAGAARVQAGYWHDSVTLWSRALTLDGSNDVALYNRALALTDAGRVDEAIVDYQQLLLVIPDHDLARHALAKLLADRDERSGAALAAAGRFRDAIQAYDRALAQDPTRIRVRASRGMARLSLGDVPHAVPDLEAALAGGVDDVAVVNGLSYAWMSVGRAGDALRLLSDAERRHPDDVGIVTNLSRLLVTIDAPELRDPQRALALTERVNARTGARDPRVLDALALALAATGDRTRAAAALDRAVELARESGDSGLSSELAQRRSRLPR